MKIVVTGGMGFVGSHAAEFYAKKGHEVVVVDNLSRGKLLNADIPHLDFNKNMLSKISNIELIQDTITDPAVMETATKGADAIIHAAAQTAVTTSVTNPRPDFETNALGTFNVFEAARKNDVKSVVYCSTNKVFGENVNNIGVTEGEKRYDYEEKYKNGVPGDFSIDHCEHTPYGVSKLTGDLYAQDYGHLYGIRTGVFRMSCIYGTRQFGIEDQGWVAWFAIATLLGKKINIYGDGKQVRDVLYVSDLIDIYDKFLTSNVKNGVYNTGGGPANTMSLLEYLDILEKVTGKRSETTFGEWRPSDQKVFIADISKAEQELGWKPQVTPEMGVKNMVDFIEANKNIF